MKDLRKKGLRKQISDIYRKSNLGSYLRPLYKLYELGLRLVPDKVLVKQSFKRHMGYTLDLDNPQTLNEKINWLKLYNRKDLHTLVSDKYKVRNYVKQKIGEQYLVPLLFETKNPKDLKPENMPDKAFIIKTNHDSSGGVIVRDKNNTDWKKIQKRFKGLLKENHYYSTREWQYKNIEPRIVVEKLLRNEDGSIPNDYKFHCFHGKMAFLNLDLDRHSNQRARNLYDKDWNLLPCNWGRPNGKNVDAPSNFEEMKRLAEKLAEDFIYVRVDFYSVKGKTYFGEITLHQSSGFRKFWQHECDERLGAFLNLKLINTN